MTNPTPTDRWTTEEISQELIETYLLKGPGDTGRLEVLIKEALDAERALIAEKDAEIARLTQALTLIAFDYHEDNPDRHLQKYTPSQIALHAIRIEPLCP